MRAHYLQHVPFEGLGSIETWLLSRGFDVSSTRLFESSAFPDPRDLALLVVLGGPMSVHDEDYFPWLRREKQFVRETVLAGIPVLGVCLGAQLIAEVMGGRVYPNRVKEIGWFPILSASREKMGMATFEFPPSLEVFHWHGDTFELPPAATRLASSDACLNQAFQIGESVIGLQFHLEVTPDLIEAMVRNGRAELHPDEFVQVESIILAPGPERFQRVNRTMGRILQYLTGKEAGPAS